MGKRTFEIKNWLEYGGTKTDLLVPGQSFQNGDSLEQSKQIKPIGIALAVKDFNAKDQDSEIKCDTEVQFLSFMKDDLIILTTLPNRWGWFEGYRARDNS